MIWLIGKNIEIVDPFQARLCLAKGKVKDVSNDAISLIDATLSSSGPVEQKNANLEITIPILALRNYIIKHV